jgi:hypothetical protein
MTKNDLTAKVRELKGLPDIAAYFTKETRIRRFSIA